MKAKQDWFWWSNKKRNFQMRVSFTEFVQMKNFFENENKFPENMTKEQFSENCERIIREYFIKKDEMKGRSPNDTLQDPNQPS